MAPAKQSSTSRINILKSKYLGKFDSSPTVAKVYAIFAASVLIITSLFWALLGANLQRGNADQLIDPYLFKNSSTFHSAVFPSQHTFFIKWPLFLLIKLFGYSNSAYIVLTVGLVLVTIFVLILVLYRIARNQLVFGTLCLALASVLLLVPAQPYPGALLPINMAMLSTRNIEYIFYIVAISLFARAVSIKNWNFWAATGLMVLLIASDKLFLTLGIGGALLALMVYALFRRWQLVSLAVNWLFGMLVATAGAFCILWLLHITGTTHISNQTVATPYALASNIRNIALGATFAVTGLLTNFGANPAFDATVIKNVPHQAYQHLLSIGGPAFVINAIIFICGLLIIWRLLRLSLGHYHIKGQLVKTDSSFKLAIMLIWTSLVAVGAFVFSNHYYAVDARYLTISVFTIFIAGAVYASRKKWQAQSLVLIGSVIVISIIFGVASTLQTYHKGKAALDTANNRDNVVVQVLHSHKVSLLVGDYWRVVPTKVTAHNQINVLPLAGCTQPRVDLSSQLWQLDLRQRSFAYLLSFDQKLTDYPSCTLAQVVDVYGRPNASQLIAGQLGHPSELLLFYDHGARNSSPTTPQPSKGPSTVVPTTLDLLPNTSCAVPTIMNIVAHQDDDLLFLNPDLIHNIRANYCVRTVYVTAGDDGRNAFYWLAREQGSEAAYSTMAGLDRIWIQRIVQLDNNQFVMIASPRSNPKLSLIFMRLPDGDFNGQGFKASHQESLAKLYAGKITSMHSVDGQSTYTYNQFVAALNSLMLVYSPTEIHTQSTYPGRQYKDHSDHNTVGGFVQLAYHQYEAQQFNNQVAIPIKYYIGYPVREQPANVTGQDYKDVATAFVEYAKFDPSVCHSIQECEKTPTYGAYIGHQYTAPN